MLDFSEQLYTLLASPYSYIQIRTYEEERFVETVKLLAEQMGRKTTEWAPGNDGHGELLAALAELAEHDDDRVLVLKDAHPFLNHPTVIRRMRELEPVLRACKKVVVLISPYVDLPLDLMKDVTFLDAPLPGRVELLATLESVYTADEMQTVRPEKLVSAAMGLTQREATRAFHRARFERQLATTRTDQTFDLEASIVREKRRLIEADQVLSFVDLAQKLEDVGGVQNLKLWLKEREDAFSASAAEFGLPTPGGLLLTGVQGCGKSLFAKAVAGFWGIPLLQLDVSRLFDGSLAPEAAFNRATQTAEALSPSVLWLDEIDKAFSDDSGGQEGRMMGSLLNWLQDKRHPVFFVATANRVAKLPPELLRKGRFDEVFFVDLPDTDDRREILRIHISRRDRQPDAFDLDHLTDKTDLFSGAEIEQVVVSALFKAFAQKRDLTQEDLENAIRETVPLYRTYEEEIKAQREWASTRARPAARDRSLYDLFSGKKKS